MRTSDARAIAEQYASKGEYDRARAIYLEILSARSNDASALVQLSYLESLLGNYRTAAAYASRAAVARPSDVETAKEVLARLRTFNQAAELHELLRYLGPTRRLPIPLLISCAAQLSYLNEQNAALAYLDEAKRGDPQYPPVLLARGQVLTYLGRFSEAEADLDACTARAPQIAQAHWFLSRLRRQTAERNHVGRLLQLLQGAPRPEDRALLAYALHKELDDLGDTAEAWSALEDACRSKRSTLRYSPVDSARLVDALTRVVAEPRSTSTEVAGRIPIFIVGMHRSGTTLLEQLLDGHPEIHGVGELYDFTSQMRYATDYHCRGVIDADIVERSRDVDFRAVGKGYLKGMEWRLGKERFFTDKLPSNFLNIGFICQALPQAKILHMVRDPIETCFSNLRELFSDANPYSYDQLELADFYKQYRRLMAHWHQAYPGRILDVDYAELTRDTETVLRRVSAFCGFDFEPEMLALQNRKRGVATASAVQVRDKVVVREQPKWKPYEGYLQPLIQALRADGFVQ